MEGKEVIGVRPRPQEVVSPSQSLSLFPPAFYLLFLPVSFCPLYLPVSFYSLFLPVCFRLSLRDLRANALDLIDTFVASGINRP